MMYYEFVVGEKEYKLRLTTRNIVSLEEKVGCNPLAIFGKGDTVPTITQMIAILYTSLRAYSPNITESDAYDIFDKWIDEGHSVAEFVPIILEIYKVSGLIKSEDNTTNEKN